ncbi:Hypothetical protein, putative [Bodo saltans]|uniref:Uncharacterized protein n=1 Tax=Bodo saltans TaxID=75058 RepID=A0A0S4J4W6_BODSA|nr:Hypothetical protein, putative [Bodo saltans]|eukprot:CUG79085.1 Hypothetical protein, putative [Bodo saltans]
MWAEHWRFWDRGVQQSIRYQCCCRSDLCRRDCCEVKDLDTKERTVLHCCLNLPLVAFPCELVVVAVVEAPAVPRRLQYQVTPKRPKEASSGNSCTVRSHFQGCHNSLQRLRRYYCFPGLANEDNCCRCLQ